MELSSPRSTRFGIGAVVIALHILVIAGLVRVFSPNFVHQVTENVISAFNVTITPPEPTPSPPPPQPNREKDAGKSGEAGKKAVAKAIAAPTPKIVIKTGDAPKVASTGNASTSGAASSGNGTGAGGAGNGTGAGGSGNGGGGGSPLEHIGGNISSAKDYPKANRALRNGSAVTVQMTVGIDGRARNCRVVKPSPDAEADAITCRLIEQRFRFRPKTNAAGQPVEAEYRWQQRWWNPRDGSGEN